MFCFALLYYSANRVVLLQRISNRLTRPNHLYIHDINIIASLPRQIGNRDNYVQYENMRD